MSIQSLLRRALAASFLAVLWSPSSVAQESSFQRPKYHDLLRQNEDWSVLRDVDRRATDDFWDRFKFVPLDEEGRRWISFGGQARARGELWRDFNFGSAPAGKEVDDELALLRLLLHADLHLGRDLRFFIQGKSATLTERELPGGRRTVDEDRADVQQLFADVSFGEPEDTRFTLRPGRSMLSFGKQRLVSPLGWSNSLRAWDGVQGIVEQEDWKVTSFWTRFVEVRPTRLNKADTDNQFYGVYAARPSSGTTPGLDLYWLALHNEQAAFNGTSGGEERHTLGSRVSGRVGSSAWDYDLEAAYQLGRVGQGDVSAWMLGSELGRNFPDTRGRPRLWLGLDHGSGDSRPGGNVGTFNQLYPLGHAYLGYVDTIGRQNIWDASVGVAISPVEKTRVSLAHHAFWLADTADALYNAGGGVMRPGGTADSSWVGNEVDLTVTHAFDRHLSGLLGYSRFFAGDAIRQSGSSSDIDFVYVSLQYTF